MIRDCRNCRHENKTRLEYPCKSCIEFVTYKYWESKKQGRLKFFIIAASIWAVLLALLITGTILNDHYNSPKPVGYRIESTSETSNSCANVLSLGNSDYLLYQSYVLNKVWIVPFNCEPYKLQVEFVEVGK